MIARFLVNLRSGFELERAERIVAATFEEHHPEENFNDWNKELNDAWCENVIRSEPNPSYVKVDKFILDLWDMH